MNKATEKPPILWLQTLVFSITLLIALIAVPWYAFTHGYSLAVVICALLFWISNGISITAGYHRLWSHHTYKAHPLLQILLALFGAAATQNSILVWASGHRRHHRHVDDNERDPYSAKKGFWFSHIGWMLRHYDSGKDNFDNAKDLQHDKIVMWQHRHYLAITLAMNFIPPLLVGIATGDIIGSLLLVGVLRLVISHHTTFLINSLAHIWGKRPYTESNTARDNGFIALLTYGEGYHNYHHLFQYDYRNGVRWWQFDPTKWLIKSASWVGLTKDLKRAPSFKILKAMLDMKFKKAQEKLASTSETEEYSQLEWSKILEQEYQQFSNILNEWNQLRQKWYEQKRDKLNEATHALQEKWHSTALHTRFKELKYALKMQTRRLDLLTQQFATA
ncbi:fatty acid desaturase [uncultured Microbulbifer sp.]|uniref:acyl-CoA desaturase n=1 Tax=uncultured Microbulbifer sp. TaxID=348147 RepID=UPI00262EAC6D|nr:fatty acid desaturase [uncultured Microbulbifer sp.]